MANDNWMGIISVIIGLVLLISPTMGVTAISIISGIILTGFGIWMAINAFKERKTNTSVTVIWIIFAIISLAFGLSLVFRTFLISLLAGAWVYVTAVLLIIAGVLLLLSAKQSNTKKNIGVIALVLGLIYIIMGALGLDPIYIGVAIGLIFIGYGGIALWKK
ncbi:DUF308 domain-containing protein [Methanobacterium alcaliphilum]|uniref:DUF308 domain-containing protein n=1 Tax=Methanobacterium alcaliphilum TaxID=392018 RepID=UPI00200A0B58|nr:DUF308 domain-containing protein [Methanobacterium alcaliphilum]MCK9150942.1 DUF308 domain-containing protein [Methanobacterium alcaliphilum]